MDELTRIICARLPFLYPKKIRFDCLSPYMPGKRPSDISTGSVTLNYQINFGDRHTLSHQPTFLANDCHTFWRPFGNDMRVVVGFIGRLVNHTDILYPGLQGVINEEHVMCYNPDLIDGDLTFSTSAAAEALTAWFKRPVAERLKPIKTLSSPEAYDFYDSLRQRLRKARPQPRKIVALILQYS